MERGDHPFSPAAAASALQWWADAGVDVIVDEQPRDWLRPVAATPKAIATASEASATRLPESLPAFQEWLRVSDHLPYASPSAPRLGPFGDPASGLMIFVDMPTVEDGRAGSLLSGEAGRLFDRMMAAIGRGRDSLYLAPLSCFRSPDGRFTPDAERECAGIARHHIGLVMPQAVLLFGDACSKALLGKAVTPIRGRWHEIATAHGPVRTLASFSPAHLLNQPSAKAPAWADLQMLLQGLTP